MFSKIIIFALALAAVVALEDTQGHGHAYSSQSIVLHNTHHDIGHGDDHKVQKETIAYYQPAVHHIEPAVQHVTAVHHVAPIVHHVAPVVQHAPVINHVAPVVEHVAPVVHLEQNDYYSNHKYAPVVHQVAPVVHQAPIHQDEKHEEYYSHPNYEFAYEVKDTHTHDIKSQHEHRNGDVVKGEYSLHQPDGAVRTVKYYGDHKSGFNAEVHYDAPSHHAQPVQHDNHY